MEAAILKFFESIRCPALTVFFGAFSLIGEAAVLAAVVLLVYWLAAGRTGEQLAVSVLSSVPLNVSAKYAFSRTRPYAAGVVERLDVDNFLLSTRDLGDTISFPSGHAQAAASLFVSVPMRAKNRWWVWVLAVLGLLLVMCSRLYFGVHYPTDVLAGALLGSAVAVMWELVYRFLYRGRYFFLCGFALLALIPLFFACPHDYVQAAGLISGAAIFLPLANMIEKKAAPFPKRLWRIPAGALAAGAVFALTLLFPAGNEGLHLLKWFLITGAATLGAQALFRAFRI